MENNIRDIRESKGLSQTAAAELCGLTFSRYERIELGSPRTTEDEVKAVTAKLRTAKKTGKKLVGRPFSDPKKQAAVEKARAEGKPLSLVLGTPTAAPVKKTTAPPAKKATPAKKTTGPAKKAAGKAPAKKSAGKAPAEKAAPAKAGEELL